MTAEKQMTVESRTRYTPGPWHADWVRPDATRGHTFEPRCAIMGNDPQYGAVRLADVADPVDENAEANARLIAAAPELLEALVALTAHITHDVQEPCGADCEFVIDANATIAKALNG